MNTHPLLNSTQEYLHSWFKRKGNMQCPKYIKDSICKEKQQSGMIKGDGIMVKFMRQNIA